MSELVSFGSCSGDLDEVRALSLVDCWWPEAATIPTAFEASRHIPAALGHPSLYSKQNSSLLYLEKCPESLITIHIICIIFLDKRGKRPDNAQNHRTPHNPKPKQCNSPIKEIRSQKKAAPDRMKFSQGDPLGKNSATPWSTQPNDTPSHARITRLQKPSSFEGGSETDQLKISKKKIVDIIQDTFSLLFSTVPLLWVAAPSC